MLNAPTLLNNLKINSSVYGGDQSVKYIFKVSLEYIT